MKYITVDPKLAARATWECIGAGALSDIVDIWPIMSREVVALMKYPDTWGNLASHMVVMAIWNAGRIQGIREERARRRGRR